MGEAQGAGAPVPVEKYCQGCLFQARDMGEASCEQGTRKFLESDGVDYLRHKQCLEQDNKSTVFYKALSD